MSKFCNFSVTAKRYMGLHIVNKNVRNLEKLYIASKPKGWHLEEKGLNFCNKLNIRNRFRFVEAEVVNFDGSTPVVVSTKELLLQLHSPNDVNAYKNLGRLFAFRCLECGIVELSFFIDLKYSKKIEAFLTELQDNGVMIVESPKFENPQPSDWIKPEKPWEYETKHRI